MPCSGMRTVTWTVCGRKPFLANDTDWFSGGTVSEQGVRQVWPCAVRTSAPGGSDSNCKAVGGGGDEWNDIQSGMESDEPEPRQYGGQSDNARCDDKAYAQHEHTRPAS